MKNIIIFLFLALMWGSAFAGIKIGVATIPPVPLVAGRMILATLIMLSYLFWRGRNLSKDPQIWLSYFIVGMLSNIFPYLLITYGEQRVDSALAAIFMGIAPVATVLLAPQLIEDEHYTPRSILGIVFGFLGLIILVGPDALNNIGADLWGQCAILLAAICYASSGLYVRRYVTQPPIEMAAGSLLIGTLSIFIFGFLTDSFSNLPSPSDTSLIALVYLGIFPTAIAAILYFYLIKSIGVSSLSMINFAVPVIGAILGILFFNEKLTPSTWIALCFISIAVYLVNKKSKKNNFKAEH